MDYFNVTAFLSAFDGQTLEAAYNFPGKDSAFPVLTLDLCPRAGI